jgi:cysteine-rich repeat protein
MLATGGAHASTIAQNSSWTVSRPGASQTLRVVAYGDSIFAGYTGATTAARRAAPYVMAEYCAALTGQNFQVHRRCQSGAVASGIYDRIHSTTDRAFMQDASTRIVTFEMCGNDYLQARSSFKSAAGVCNYTGLNTAFTNCKNFTQAAMTDINTFANANTKLKIVSNLYYPGYDADNSFSTCTDAVNGDPANGNRVNMRKLFLPRIAESNWWVCKLASDNGFLCADSFAMYMARDYDSNGDGQIDSDQIRYRAGESLDDYKARIVAAAPLLRDANFKLVTSVSSFDYIQSDDTHPTFEGATASTFLTTPGGSNPVLFASAGPYPDGKNIHWNQNGHDRMGWGLDPACPFVAPKCGNGTLDTSWLPSGTARVEQCDDGNTTDGDGCNHDCSVESGYTCSGAPSMCATVCGDNIVKGGEQCDDGDAMSGDGCSATCTVEPGFSCIGSPSTCQYICGDGLVVLGEGCDDGNLATADGCSSGCAVEDGWTCGGEPSVCSPICGDSQTVGSEACDEGEANGTLPSCCAENCSTQPVGTTCDDGNACTDNTCDGGTTCLSVPTNCDDHDPCTDDSCNPATGCIHTNNTASCDDGNACTTNDTCSAGVCVGGEPPNCNDSNGCTNDGCDPSSGCTHEDNTDPCNDGNACTTSDTCAEGACVGGAPPNCNDGNVCTDDTCYPATGCANTNNTAPCNDGNSCTAPDVCGGGTCHAGAAVYSFGGFQPPVDNLPIVNVGKAGRTYPVKWQLSLCAGGYVSRLNAVVYNPLRVREINCASNDPLDTLETETPGETSLTYDVGSNSYHFNWKTNTAFANRCYDLLLELDNGTTQTARFKFTK